jgi:hypothetical protein
MSAGSWMGTRRTATGTFETEETRGGAGGGAVVV